VTAIVLLLIGLLAGQAPGAVTGVVTDEATKAPVAGANVVLAPAEGPVAGAAVTTTDDRGRFAFAKVQPGTYRLLAGRDDYLRGESSPPIPVAAGESVRNLAVTLTPTAVISGRVTDDYGEPAGKIYVRALTTRVVAEARTNDLGEYRLFGLAPGTYVVSAERYQAPSIQGTFLVTPTPPCPGCMGEGAGRQGLTSLLTNGAFIDPRALTGQTYPPVFFPGTTDRSAAGQVTVKAGAQVDAIDLRLVVR
jgi:hypothetical protein